MTQIYIVIVVQSTLWPLIVHYLVGLFRVKAQLRPQIKVKPNYSYATNEQRQFSQIINPFEKIG